MADNTDCYDVPQYWDMAFGEDTLLEADFIEAAATKYCNFPVRTMYEPGCGGGRLVVELAKRGYSVTGVDQSSAAVAFAKTQLAKASVAATVQTGDMKDLLPDTKFDLAFCLVNTFRHLLTEEDAIQHLTNVASMLSEGGLYIIGMHLLPPDADEEDEEEWSITEGDTTIDMQLVVEGCDRTTRLETLQFKMTVLNAAGEEIGEYNSGYRMRTYEAAHMVSLLAKVPAFELLDVYDFWYDLEEPLELSDELGDTVFVLRKIG
ncbi:MAG: class I SAM-dependent methyltransferase [Fuerstiella sp.]